MQLSERINLHLFFLTSLSIAGLLAIQGLAPLSSLETVPKPEVLTKVPAFFIPNAGQIDEQADFYSQGTDYNLYMAKKGLLYSFSQAEGIAVTFQGANESPQIVGTDQSQWLKDLPTFGAITYKELYPGIDAVYKSAGATIKYSFMVTSEADPSSIRMAYSQGDLRLDSSGNLLISTPWGDLEDEKPIAYQIKNGRRVPVEAGFSLNGQIVGFSLGAYNKALPLVINVGR